MNRKSFLKSLIVRFASAPSLFGLCEISRFTSLGCHVSGGLLKRYEPTTGYSDAPAITFLGGGGMGATAIPDFKQDLAQLHFNGEIWDAQQRNTVKRYSI